MNEKNSSENKKKNGAVKEMMVHVYNKFNPNQKQGKQGVVEIPRMEMTRKQPAVSMHNGPNRRDNNYSVHHNNISFENESRNKKRDKSFHI